MKRLWSIFAAILVLGGCANPLNRATMGRYAQTCSDAERAGQLDVAEEACRRALINVRIGNLGQELESQALYNFARTKKNLHKFAEAEEYYKESLRIQEALSTLDSTKIGRRLADISIVIGAQGQFKEAWPFLSRLIPLSGNFSGDERSTVKLLFNEYAKEYDKLQMSSEAQLLRITASEL